MGNSEATEWQAIPTVLDGIDSVVVDVASGPANGNLALLVAAPGTIESRHCRPPFFLLEFEGAEKLVVQSDTFYSILGPRSGSWPAVLSESLNSSLLADVRGFRGDSRRHFVVSGFWHHFEVVAGGFKVRKFDSELAARTFAVEAVLA